MIKFGTFGFRAVMEEDFTKENIQKITQAIVKVIKKQKSTKPVVVGYDRRFMSDQAAKWVAEVFAGNNVPCKLYTKPVPSPVVSYTVKAENLDFGIIITASHNPYYYNGYKIAIKGGFDANANFTDNLEKLANANIKIKTMDYDTAVSQGLITLFDNLKDYIKNISKFVSKEIKDNKIKVLFNAMHGTTVDCAKMIAKLYNIKQFDIINDNQDPYFEYKLPCPNESTLEDFKKQVVRGRYTIGLACDGDGDRLGVVDELGQFYNCNEILAILYYYLVKYRNMQGDIVKTYSDSIILAKLAEKFGFKCHETPAGFKYVSVKIAETNALIGGEHSGGITMRNYTPTKDSMFAISLLLDALAIIKKPLSKIVEEVKGYAEYYSTYRESSFLIKNNAKFTKTLRKKIPAFSYKAVSIIKDDGFKYIFEDGSFVFFRFSGTENRNLLRCCMEFSTEIECERNQKAIENYINTYNK